MIGGSRPRVGGDSDSGPSSVSATPRDKGGNGNGRDRWKKQKKRVAEKTRNWKRIAVALQGRWWRDRGFQQLMDTFEWVKQERARGNRERVEKKSSFSFPEWSSALARQLRRDSVWDQGYPRLGSR